MLWHNTVTNTTESTYVDDAFATKQFAYTVSDCLHRGTVVECAYIPHHNMLVLRDIWVVAGNKCMSLRYDQKHALLVEMLHHRFGTFARPVNGMTPHTFRHCTEYRCTLEDVKSSTFELMTHNLGRVHCCVTNVYYGHALLQIASHTFFPTTSGLLVVDCKTARSESDTHPYYQLYRFPSTTH